MTGELGEKNLSFWDFRGQRLIGHDDEPLLMAEELDATIAEENMRHFSEAKTPEGLVHSSWRMIEYALSQSTPLDQEMRKRYISYYAQQLLADVLAMSKYGNPLHRYVTDYRSTPQQNHFHQALLLGAFAPLFSKRAAQEPIDREDCRNLYDSMQHVIQEELHAGQAAQDARLSENIATILGARTGQPEYILFPASPREEASHSQSHNHDRYFLHDGHKTPVQIKIGATALEYDAPVVVLDIEGVLSYAAERTHLAAPDMNTVTPHVHLAADLLTYEHAGNFLYPEERAFLNIASQAIVGIQKKSPHQRQAA